MAAEGGSSRKKVPRGDDVDNVKANLKNAYNKFIIGEKQRFQEKNNRAMTRQEWADLTKHWKTLDVQQKLCFANEGADRVKDSDSLVHLWDVVCRPSFFAKHVKGLTAEQRKLAHETGLGCLLDNNVTQLQGDLICWLARSFDVSTRSLIVYGRRFRVAPSDVTSVMGLVDGSSCLYLKNKSPLVSQYCKQASGHLVIDLSGLVDKLADSRGDEFKRCYVLFAIATVLRPSTRQYLHHKWVSAVDNVDILSDCQWATLTLDHLVSSITNVFEARVKKLGGCALFLQVYYLRYILPGAYLVGQLTLPIQYFSKDVTSKLLKKRPFRDIEEVGLPHDPKRANKIRETPTKSPYDSPSALPHFGNGDIGADHDLGGCMDDDGKGKAKVGGSVDEFEKGNGGVTSLGVLVRKLVSDVGVIKEEQHRQRQLLEDLKEEQQRQRALLDEVNANVSLLVQTLKTNRVKEVNEFKRARPKETHGSNAPFHPPPHFPHVEVGQRCSEGQQGGVGGPTNLNLEDVKGGKVIGGDDEFDSPDKAVIINTATPLGCPTPVEPVLVPSGDTQLDGKPNPDVVIFNLDKTELGSVDMFSDAMEVCEVKGQVKPKKKRQPILNLLERPIRIPKLSRAQTSPFTMLDIKKSRAGPRFGAGPFGVRHPVSPEEHQLLMYIFYGPCNDSDLLVKPGGPYEIRRFDLKLLLPTEWISNVLINTWAVILTNRARARGSSLRNWYLTLDFTFMAARPAQYLQNLRTNEQLRSLLINDINNCDKIFLPIHEPAHFYLLVVDVNLMTISVWDTLGKGHTIEYYSEEIDLQCAALDEVVAPPKFKFSEFQKVKPKEFPVQPNTCDCGLFVCYFMEHPTRVTMSVKNEWDTHERRCQFVLDLLLCDENLLKSHIQSTASMWFESQRKDCGGVDVRKEQILSVDEVVVKRKGRGKRGQK